MAKLADKTNAMSDKHMENFVRSGNWICRSIEKAVTPIW